jgi:2-dehydropantoate 2-reductase
MLQDILKEKRTEIDFINGVIVREGRKRKIPVPVNTVLTLLVKTLEKSFSQKIRQAQSLEI